MKANREKARSAYEEARALTTKHVTDRKKSKISVKKYRNAPVRYGYSYSNTGGNKYVSNKT